ncbi:MAG: CPBP family glutamic-type intramembrane protease [Candidatus Eisenbacteria bacterium]|uniref:CPBP family intramembrane metalloprotease n=1 Tax=Eiseniibacteriota bacterium TaxID=2212470 RepID=A0A956LW29_UNCEI|nr:CPBP family intramembrane metalloprotease [Candidatus Eisenbacteria bacterium]
MRITRRDWNLLLFSAATIVLLALERPVPGVILWLGAFFFVLRDPEPAYRRRLGLLLGVILLLSFAPIHTDTSTPHFLSLGAFFLVAILIPTLVFARTDPGVIDYRLWPRKFRWIDLVYVAIAIPLAYLVVQLYFFHANPWMPTHWYLPPVYDDEKVWRLVVGLNGVGIWDELFFVNIVFATLRSLHDYRRANLAQAVVYTSVLYNMAFTGIGPIVVYAFALTQGSMYEQSRNLFYVLLVHLIVDAFLLEAIIRFYYPGHGAFHWF